MTQRIIPSPVVNQQTLNPPNSNSCCLTRIRLCFIKALYSCFRCIGDLLCLRSLVSSTPSRTNPRVAEVFRGIHPEQSVQPQMLPVVVQLLKPGFFVEVLNRGGYSLAGKDVIIPPAGLPVKFMPANDKNFNESIRSLRETYKINDQHKIAFQFKDRTTEEAINESNSSRIALNFANEKQIGGRPGFHKEEATNLFIYDAPSAKAQEESLSQRTNLLASLTQLSHTLKADSGNSRFSRGCYAEEFDSRKMAYVSLNHLFAVQEGRNFYQSRYLSEPKAVAFITSAGKYYGSSADIDCSQSSDVYLDAKARIKTHLLAAAFRAGISKAEKPDQPVELILGAFGCGAFAPQKNADSYREMIAGIYKELLSEFHGFFDFVTFAVPTFGSADASLPAVANHTIFKRILAF
jgi:uncharacterized protein (TIGR02452 family)